MPNWTGASTFPSLPNITIIGSRTRGLNCRNTIFAVSRSTGKLTLRSFA
mgnify:CR=1 FL=1